MLVKRRDVRQVNVPAHDDVRAGIRPRWDRFGMTMQTIVNFAAAKHVHRLMRDHDSNLSRARGR